MYPSRSGQCQVVPGQWESVIVLVIGNTACIGGSFHRCTSLKLLPSLLHYIREYTHKIS